MNASTKIRSTVTKLVSVPHLSPSQDPVQEFLPSQEPHTINTPTVSNKTTNTIATLKDNDKTPTKIIKDHISLTQLNEGISFVSSHKSDETYNDDDLSYDSSIVSMPPLFKRTTIDSDSSSSGDDDSSKDRSSYYFEENKDNIIEWLEDDDDTTLENEHLSLSLKHDDESIISTSNSIEIIDSNNDITNNNNVARTSSLVRTTTANLASILSNNTPNVDTDQASTNNILPDDVTPLQTTTRINSTTLVDNRVEPRRDSIILDTVPTSKTSAEVHDQLVSDNNTIINKRIAK